MSKKTAGLIKLFEKNIIILEYNSLLNLTLNCQARVSILTLPEISLLPFFCLDSINSLQKQDTRINLHTNICSLETPTKRDLISSTWQEIFCCNFFTYAFRWEERSQCTRCWRDQNCVEDSQIHAIFRQWRNFEVILVVGKKKKNFLVPQMTWNFHNIW